MLFIIFAVVVIAIAQNKLHFEQAKDKESINFYVFFLFKSQLFICSSFLNH